MKISLIAAVARNGVIGRGLELPWRLSADLKRFKSLTMGHHLLMGRKTYESIGKPLPGRKIVVISRGAPTLGEGAELAGSLENAIVLADARNEDELLVAGGGEIYRLAMRYADRLYLTRVDAEVDGDVYFPELESQLWTVSQESAIPAGPKDEHPTVFSVYDRIVPELAGDSG